MEPYIYRIAVLSSASKEEQIGNLKERVDKLNEDFEKDNYKIEFVEITPKNLKEELAEGAFNDLIYFSDIREKSSNYEKMVKILAKTSGIHINPVIQEREGQTPNEVITKEEEWLSHNADSMAIATPTTRIKDEREEKVFINEIKGQALLQLGQAKEISEGQNEYFQQFVFTCLDMIRERDEYTYTHSIRVADYAKMVAEEMGYSKAEANVVFIAAVLHDIGKSAISNEVLNKPGKLEGKDKQEMAEHDEIGAEMLEGFQKMSGLISDIIVAGAEGHHIEGYQETDDKAIQVAQIIKVADCFDAATSQRDYNTPKNIIDAMKDVWGNRDGGTRQNMFSPEYSKAFLLKLGKELATIGYDISEFLPDIEEIEANNKDEKNLKEEKSLKEFLMEHKEEFTPQNPPNEYTPSGIKLSKDGHIIHKDTQKYKNAPNKALQNEINFQKGADWNKNKTAEEIENSVKEQFEKADKKFENAVKRSDAKHGNIIKSGEQMKFEIKDAVAHDAIKSRVEAAAKHLMEDFRGRNSVIKIDQGIAK